MTVDKTYPNPLDPLDIDELEEAIEILDEFRQRHTADLGGGSEVKPNFSIALGPKFLPELRRGLSAKILDPASKLTSFERTFIAEQLLKTPDEKIPGTPRQAQQFNRDLQIAFNTKAIMNDWQIGKRESMPDDHYSAAQVASREVHERGEAFVYKNTSGETCPQAVESGAWKAYADLREYVERFEEIAGPLTGLVSRTRAHYAYKVAYAAIFKPTFNIALNESMLSASD